MLVMNKTLVSFSLALKNSGIHDQGVYSLFVGLEKNRTLRHLKLSFNNIKLTDIGMQNMIEHFQSEKANTRL